MKDKKEPFSLIYSLRLIIRLIGWDKKAITEIAQTKEATIFGLFWLVISGIALVINTALEYETSFNQYFVGPVLVIATTCLAALILHGIAKAFKGKGSSMMLLRTFSFLSPISMISLLGIDTPYFSWLIGLYIFLTTAKLVQETEKLSYGKSIITVLIPIVTLIITTGLVIFFLRQTVISSLGF